MKLCRLALMHDAGEAPVGNGSLHSARPECLQLQQIFSEFTILGFLAMVTYFMIQANVLGALSTLVYGDAEHLVHLFERARAVAAVAVIHPSPCPLRIAA